MAFNVRLYGHAGLTRMKVIGAAQFSSDSVFNLQQPYLWGQTVSVSASAASSVAATPDGGLPDNTDIVRIEVPDGSSIRYEINPPSRPGGVKTAGTNSPILSGLDQFKFGRGWTVSLIDAAGLP